MTDKELTARIAELNAQRAALKKERDKLVWEEGIPAIIAKMKRLGGDTIWKDKLMAAFNNLPKGC